MGFREIILKDQEDSLIPQKNILTHNIIATKEKESEDWTEKSQEELLPEEIQFERMLSNRLVSGG